MKMLCSSLAMLLLPPTASGQTVAPITVSTTDTKPLATASLTMYPQFMAGDFFARNWMKTVPHRLTFTATHPDGITKEPTYKGKPLYASIKLGDDPKAPVTWIVVDDDANKIYIDDNQDGDLTNDPRVGWDKTTKDGDKVSYDGCFAVPANWKTGPGKYGMKIYRAAGSENAGWQTVGAPTGPLTIDGKTYVMFLYDSDGKGDYSLKEDPATKTSGTRICIDVDGDGTWRPLGAQEDTMAGKSIKLGDKWYSFEISADGHTAMVHPGEAPAAAKFPTIALKKAGDKAPDFEMVLPDGKKVHLSDYKGKAVVIDFWATWCGPCQKAMPDVQKMYATMKDDPKVAFVGLCVSDEKTSFDKWIKENSEKYTFTFGFDPAGNVKEGKDQCYLWGVNGIPTTFVVDGNGIIVESVSGFTPENEDKVAKALDKLRH